jgi:phosphotriesterase-related protein
MVDTVQTVLGPVKISDMGRTLVHEHLYITIPGWEFEPALADFDRAGFVEEAVGKVKALKEFGVGTFVDPCPIELGRDVRLIAEVSEKAEMNVVCTTGFYFEEFGLPAYWRHQDAEDIARHYIKEITEGIDGTSIRAGAIKVATGEEVSHYEHKFATAAAMAQVETGVPIITHTEKGCCGPDQQDIFAEGGVKMHHCLIGHSCGNPDPAYHKKIVDRGTYIGFDRIGYEMLQPDSLRADNLVKLLDAGHMDQILMSQDKFCHLRGVKGLPMTREEIAAVEELMEQGVFPAPYTDIFNNFLPMLKERGVSDDHIDHMLRVNPQRFFSGEPFGSNV